MQNNSQSATETAEDSAADTESNIISDTGSVFSQASTILDSISSIFSIRSGANPPRDKPLQLKQPSQEIIKKEERKEDMQPGNQVLTVD